MYPFIYLGSVAVPTYSVCIFIGIAAGLLAALAKRGHKNANAEDLLYMVILGAVGTLVGGKVLSLIVNAPEIIGILMSDTPALAISHITGGFVFYGGLIGAMLFVIRYLIKYKLPFWDYFNLIIVSVPLAHAFGRMGCFFAGCCYGIHVDPPLGVYFVNSVVGPRDVPYLPVQLIEAAFLFILFLVMSLLYKKESLARGGLAAIYCASYAIVRFFLEFLRGDPGRGELLFLSTSQWISIMLMITAIALIFYKPRTKTISA